MLFNAVSSNFKAIQGGGEKKFEKFVLIIKMLLNIVLIGFHPQGFGLETMRGSNFA